jgi:hypothetical protein
MEDPDKSEKNARFQETRQAIADAFRASAIAYLESGKLAEALGALLAGRAIEQGRMDEAMKWATDYWASVERLSE